MKTSWFEEALDDYVDWQTQDKKTIKRINELIKDSKRNGYSGIGKQEPLKGEFCGFWSKRIDNVNRFVCRIKDGVLEVLSRKGHYDDYANPVGRTSSIPYSIFGFAMPRNCR